MSRPNSAIEVAVFVPLRQTFHYLSNLERPNDEVAPGSLVRVPFGRGIRNGIALRVGLHPEADRHLKSIVELIDPKPIINQELMQLGFWSSEYYHHPIGEVLAAMLPGKLRRLRAPERRQKYEWVATQPSQGRALTSKAPRQASLLRLLERGPMLIEDFQTLTFDWRRALSELEKKSLVHRRVYQAKTWVPPTEEIDLNNTQEDAVASIISGLGSFRTYLLHGVTGSGKTEVYMGAITDTLKLNQTVLMLVPEIILTHVLVARLKRRFGMTVAVLHSGLSDKGRVQIWQQCRHGEIKVLIGTRSAVWAPLRHIGLIVVDEEHDSSFKQQEGFRYNARDIAIKRAQQLCVPIVLGTATPSLEAYLNVEKNKYVYLSLPERTGVAKLPSLACIDIRGLKMTGGLSDRLCLALGKCLDRGEQALLFLNRRGFAPVILCHQCGYIVTCERCDAKLVWHKNDGILICHQCDSQKHLQKISRCCEVPDLVPIGLGTEQVEEALKKIFPGKIVVRIDRDSMRKKGTMEETFSAIREGSIDILIGTQMLAKGHDFSRVSLVGIVDADSQLFSSDFRAEEKLAQMIIQVAGRAGRADIPGEVLIQTHQPHHPLLQTLLADGYHRFAKDALKERRAASLPPYVAMAMIRAEAPNPELPLKFLTVLIERVRAQGMQGSEILGPIPAAVERKAGRYRAQMAITAQSRMVLAATVKSFVDASSDVPMRRKVRWAIDIDPHDTI